MSRIRAHGRIRTGRLSLDPDIVGLLLKVWLECILLGSRLLDKLPSFLTKRFSFPLKKKNRERRNHIRCEYQRSLVGFCWRRPNFWYVLDQGALSWTLNHDQLNRFCSGQHRSTNHLQQGPEAGGAIRSKSPTWGIAFNPAFPIKEGASWCKSWKRKIFRGITTCIILREL